MASVAAKMDGLSFMTLNDWIAIVGASMAVFGALTNYVFKLRADRRAKRAEQRDIAEHQARLQG